MTNILVYIEVNNNRINRVSKEIISHLQSSYPEAMIMKYDLLKTNNIKDNKTILKDTFKQNYQVIKKDNFPFRFIK